jgi:hypothetical protein
MGSLAWGWRRDGLLRTGSVNRLILGLLVLKEACQVSLRLE